MCSEWRISFECEQSRTQLKYKRLYHLLQIGFVCVDICSRRYETKFVSIFDHHGNQKLQLNLKLKHSPEQELYSISSLFQLYLLSVVVTASGQAVAFAGSHLMKAEYFTEWACDVYCLSEMRDQLLCMVFRSNRAALPGATPYPYKSHICTSLKHLLMWALASCTVFFNSFTLY